MNAPAAAAALAYAKKGLPVFPLWPAVPFRDTNFICGCGRIGCKDAAKHPLGELARNGVSDASTDDTKVKHWWRMRPDANIGLATGSTVVVIDIDPRNAGDATLAELEQTHGALPTTWRVTTGGRGWHYFFAMPDVEIKNSAGKLGSGIDVRGRGGYVVAPPSLHISGRRYAWDDGHGPHQIALAPLPAWLLEALHKSNQVPTPAAEWRELVRGGPPVASRARHEAIARLAGHLLRRYVDPLVVLELLLCWNATRCCPPLDNNEVARIVDSIAGREMRRRGFA
jgi:hypothetical protein